MASDGRSGLAYRDQKYPKLTEVGSKRIDGEGTEYSGFYTQEQIKEVVKYAADRFITIVPEIELPGHELAAISAYPELSCKGEPTTPRIIWGVEDIVLCAGKEKPFEFLQDVFDEVAPLFPGEYIHIGGDECPKSSWKECPLCQKRIREEGLKADKNHSAEEKLQSYFVQRMEKYLSDNMVKRSSDGMKSSKAASLLPQLLCLGVVKKVVSLLQTWDMRQS